jgi:hypothetical protein
MFKSQPNKKIDQKIGYIQQKTNQIFCFHNKMYLKFQHKIYLTFVFICSSIQIIDLFRLILILIHFRNFQS